MCRMTLIAATALSLVAGAAFATEPAPGGAQAGAQPAARSNPFGSMFGRRAAPAAPTTPANGQTAAQQPAPHATPQQRAEAERLDPLARAAFWAHEVENDPRDAEAGVRMAHALRDLGRYEEAANAAAAVLVIAPTNYDAMLEAGRARIAQGQGFYAVEPLQRASAAQPNDWRPVSLLAVAYEQVQRDDDARAAYQRALALSPNNAAVLSNLGLYWANHGDTAQAEQYLRRAVAAPGATARARQNLALVLGLQGRFDEAERLARQDLPPETVANNMAYLRAAVAGPGASRTWDALRAPQTP